jgi:hypothetical protein
MRPQRQLELILFAMLFVSFAYFHRTNPGWNVNSRLSLTFALVERHTAMIDAYWNTRDLYTEDAAFFEGHHYSDKIIGVSLLGVPAYWLVRNIGDAFDASLSTAAKRYWITTLSIALTGAFGAVLMFRLLLTMQGQFTPSTAGGSYAGPFIITVALFLGTMLFSYATLFMSYLPATTCFVAGMYVFERNGRALATTNRRPTRWFPAFACGLLCGFAVLCEYLFAVTTALYAAYVLMRTRNVRAAASYTLGAVIGLLPFVIYTLLLFGRPTIPYQYHVFADFRAGMSQGLMGASAPRLAPMVLLTFHPFRGLFVHSPMLLIGLFGAIAMLRTALTRNFAFFILATFITLLLYVSGYYMWWGGWSFSPRHLAPVLPLLAVGMLYAWHHRISRVLILLLAIPAIAVHLIVTATDPQVPEPRNDALLHHPSFVDGPYPNPFISQVLPAFSAGHTDPNFGTLVGLPAGLPSLIPLMGLWALAALFTAPRLKTISGTCESSRALVD